MAWGFAGGEPAVAWRCAKAEWDRHGVFGFRAACASVARSHPTNLWALERFITYVEDDSDSHEIPNDPTTRVTNESVGAEELWGEASFTFLMWRRGELADEILRSWSRHEHWRVRDFGAEILRFLAFSRVGTPVAEWLRREPNASTREHLVAALAKTGSQPAVDQCLEHFLDTGEGKSSFAEFGWRSSRSEQALEALTHLSLEKPWVAAPALVSLARMGQRAANLVASLEDGNSYLRSAAALAAAYLDDQALLPTLRNMQRETADVLESLCLSAGLAKMSKAPSDAADLQRRLVAAGGTAYQTTGTLDFFRLHDYLRRAILEALDASPSLDPGIAAAWRAETEPLA
jgi:HEAT repeat protein